MDQKFICKHWYASVYEQFENHTNDVEFFLHILREQGLTDSQNILEVACGGGRISIPLARAGHKVTGFDADEHMLLRCYRRMQGLGNITCYQADAGISQWGRDFDIVFMAGNILINIESNMDYAKVQETFILKAAIALRMGGHLLMDFDLHTDASALACFNRLGESSYFSGADELGTSGKTVSYGSVYDPVTRITSGVGHMDLTTNNGEHITFSEKWYKHIPTWPQICGWLENAGLVIERTYKNYTDQPLSEYEEGCVKATVWARKGN